MYAYVSASYDDCFVKIWATCENFLGKWFTAPPGKKIARTPMDIRDGPLLIMIIIIIIRTMQKSALLGSAHILRKVLEV